MIVELAQAVYENTMTICLVCGLPTWEFEYLETVPTFTVGGTEADEAEGYRYYRCDPCASETDEKGKRIWAKAEGRIVMLYPAYAGLA